MGSYLIHSVQDLPIVLRYREILLLVDSELCVDILSMCSVPVFHTCSQAMSHFCSDSQSRDIYTKIRHHVEVLEQSTARMSSRAEIHGAVQQVSSDEF